MPLDPKTMRTAEGRAEVAAIAELGGGNAWRIAARTSEVPDLPAVLTDRPMVNADGTPQSEFSLRELDELAQAWSCWYSDQGVRPRDRVAVYLTDGFEDQLHLTALAQLGAIPVLLNGKLPPDVAAVLIERADPVGIFSDPEHLAALGDRVLDRLGWQATQQSVGAVGRRQLPEAARYRHHADDPVLLCHSSGTTGMPKLVIWSHEQSVAGARFRLNTHPEPADSILLSAVPQSHSAAIAFTFYALLAGVPLLVVSEQSGPGVAASVARHRPTTVLAFNHTLAALALMDLDPADFSSVADWMNVGDSAHDAHIRPLMRLGNHRAEDGSRVPGSIFGDGLGSSELGWAALRRVIEPGGEVRPRCLGKVVPIAEVAVLRPDGSLAGEREVGLLGVRSASVARGYWNDHDTAVRSWLNGYWLSGDLVFREGEDFFHVDRAVDRIPTRPVEGYSLYMEELLLLQLPEVADCAVVSGRFGDQTVPVALVRLKAQHADADPAELIERANDGLARRDQPRLAVLEVDQADGAIPVGATGKILKPRLREKYADLASYLAAGSPGRLATALPRNGS